MKKIVCNLQDGYSKGYKKGWMRDEVGLQDKSTRLNNEEKSRLYSQVVHVRTYQKINGGPLHNSKYASSQKFKAHSGKWSPATTAYLIQHSWGLSNQYLKILRNVTPIKSQIVDSKYT